MLKHVLPIMLVEFLKKKPAPFFFLDTHAGHGTCDLNEAEVQCSSDYQTDNSFARLYKGLHRSGDCASAVWAPNSLENL